MSTPHDSPTQQRLVLASASPRRAVLLARLGVDFDIAPAGIDETPQLGESPTQLTLRLAEAKAAAVSRQHPGTVVLAADTVVVADGEILGKPHTAEAHAAMLHSLAGRAHRVVTGLCARAADGTSFSLTVEAHVALRIDPDLLAAYLASGEGRDAAGGYDASSVGAVLVDHLTGDPTAVAGLPLCDTHALLAAAGLHCPLARL